MKLDILSIGDELLIGQTLNTNAHNISKAVNAVGFEIRQHLSISDDEKIIIDALDQGLSHVNVVLVTGGLGPTKDDLTLPVLNKYFGGELVRDADVYRDIEELVMSKGAEMNENNKRQALVSSVCEPIRNAHGTAPGLWFERNDKVVVAMPGVPYEMSAMLENTVIPRLKEKFVLPEIVHQMVYTQGVAESKLAEIIADWEEALPSSIKLAYLPSSGRVKLRLSSKGESRAQVQGLIDKQIDRLTPLIKTYLYSYEEEKLQEVVGNLLRDKNKTLSTAESCTGGYIAHLITEIPGSSDYYLGSVVSYANEVKIAQLGVSAQDIEDYGAVSEQVVAQMAKGAQSLLKTNYAVATSGIAGPTGGSEDKPVGTVWIAVAGPNGVNAKKFMFGKQRIVNIERAAVAALGMLLRELK